MLMHLLMNEPVTRLIWCLIAAFCIKSIKFDSFGCAVIFFTRSYHCHNLRQPRLDVQPEIHAFNSLFLLQIYTLKLQTITANKVQ